MAYFDAEILHGPNAFWSLVDTYEGYKRAMPAKLVRELEGPVVGGLTRVVGGA